jgi:hypothetical protein
MNRAPILRSRGDCFANALRMIARDGILKDRGGAEHIAWPCDLLRALHHTLKAECGPADESILRDAGKAWGRSLAQRIIREMTAYHTTPLRNQPTAQVQVSLISVFSHYGWGRVEFDFARYAHGLIEITVTNGPSTVWSERETRVPDHLLAGTFTGLFTDLAGIELDCLQTEFDVPGVLPARFVVGLFQRLARVADAVRQGEQHDRVIALLESIAA